jgi:hypothetical protein
MPGIYKKVKWLIDFANKMSPFLNNVVPGLGTAVGVATQGLDKVADSVNQIHTDYTAAKKNNKKYTFADGVQSGISGLMSEKKSKLDQFSKNIIYLSANVKLKRKNDEEDNDIK